jgi:hypothetical protein
VRRDAPARADALVARLAVLTSSASSTGRRVARALAHRRTTFGFDPGGGGSTPRSLSASNRPMTAPLTRIDEPP